MAPKLTGFAGNSRVRRIRAAAALAGVELEYDNTFSMRTDWKTPEFLEKFPLGTLPTLEDGDLYLQESGAIAEYVAELGANQTLVPADKKQRALVHEWQCFADQEIFIRHSASSAIHHNQYPYHTGVFQAIVDAVMTRLQKLDSILLHRTWLVGERITLADVFVCTALNNAFTGSIDAALRAKIPNVVRYVETFNNQPKLKDIVGDTQFVDKLTYTPPAKEEKPKADKPKEAAKPKEAKPKEAKPEDDDEEPSAPAEPKVHNPLDDLPKSTFNLETWKRQYSNLDTRGANGSLEWFYQNFDHEGFSIWRVDFKYNAELTQVFMSSNQIGGFFNRLEASRKYLFGSVGVLGKANDSLISGALILRGKDYKPVVDVAPDWESYEYKNLDVNNEEDKKFFEAAMAWDLVVDGKEWADGKNFK